MKMNIKAVFVKYFFLFLNWFKGLKLIFHYKFSYAERTDKMSNQTNVFETLQTLNTGIRKKNVWEIRYDFGVLSSVHRYCAFRYLLNAKKTCMQLEGILLLAMKMNTWLIQKRFPRQSFYQNNFYLVWKRKAHIIEKQTIKPTKEYFQDLYKLKISSVQKFCILLTLLL